MKNYNSTKPSIYIEYLDMNDLNRWEMSGYLPYCGFKWLKNADNFDVNSVIENSSIGCILQVGCMYYKMIIHQLQKNLQFLMTCCQIIVKKLLTNMK